MIVGEADGTCISDVTSKPLGIPADENKDLDITYTYTITFKVVTSGVRIRPDPKLFGLNAIFINKFFQG